MRRPLDGVRVLIVSDAFFDAMIIATKLQIAGGQIVGPTDDVREVLDQMNRDRFEIAVIDLDPKHSSAAQIVRALDDHHVPFVFIERPFKSDMLAEILAERLTTASRV
jgi:DNA-binding NarL/FixJ family response regulator